MSDRPTRRRRPIEAAALGYSRGVDAAPRLLAKGSGETAARIVELARQHGIPIQQDPDLLQCLAPLQVGDAIPVEAYRAVAVILAFLYRKNSGAS
jgi:flagellar biosynthesis protein